MIVRTMWHIYRQSLEIRLRKSQHTPRPGTLCSCKAEIQWFSTQTLNSSLAQIYRVLSNNICASTTIDSNLKKFSTINQKNYQAICYKAPLKLKRNVFSKLMLKSTFHKCRAMLMLFPAMSYTNWNNSMIVLRCAKPELSHVATRI